MAPRIYTVVLENADVRVPRAVLLPGDKTAMHEHPATVAIPRTDGMGRFIADKHAVENIGKTRTEVIVIELKGKK